MVLLEGRCFVFDDTLFGAYGNWNKIILTNTHLKISGIIFSLNIGIDQIVSIQEANKKLFNKHSIRINFINQNKNCSYIIGFFRKDIRNSFKNYLINKQIPYIH